MPTRHEPPAAAPAQPGHSTPARPLEQPETLAEMLDRDDRTPARGTGAAHSTSLTSWRSRPITTTPRRIAAASQPAIASQV